MLQYGGRSTLFEPFKDIEAAGNKEIIYPYMDLVGHACAVVPGQGSYAEIMESHVKNYFGF